MEEIAVEREGQNALEGPREEGRKNLDEVLSDALQLRGREVASELTVHRGDQRCAAPFESRVPDEVHTDHHRILQLFNLLYTYKIY